jgi:hypothetical protein
VAKERAESPKKVFFMKTNKTKALRRGYEKTYIRGGRKQGKGQYGNKRRIKSNIIHIDI